MSRVSEYVIDRLVAAGIDTCFTLYGGAISDLVDALPGRMRYVVTQHEQSAVFAAEGWAKVTGKPGCVIATSGPGGQNIVTGLANCYFDSVPLIALTGQVATRFMRPKGSTLRQLGFQECNITEMVRPITKYATTVTDATRIRSVMDRALMHAMEDRRGPVLIDLPNDIQRAEITPERLPTVRYGRIDFSASIEAADFLLDLKEAKRPGILVGGGAYAARKEIMGFAVSRNLPVFRTWNALDVAPDDHPCFCGTVGTYGGAGRNFGIQNCDLLLVLGCRLSGRITGGVPESFARGAKLYVVDVDPGLLDPANQERKADVNVLCDAGKFVEALYAVA